ncbi:MAG: hypothetical protein RSC81_11415, partial [Myroides sp.]
LTKVEADKLRNEKAEFYAKQIEEETKVQEDKIKVLINNKIEDNINFSTDMSAYQKQLVENKSLFIVEYVFGNSKMLFDDKSKDNYVSTNFLSSIGVGMGAKTRIGKDESSFFWKSMLDVNFHFFKLQNDKTFENINGETVFIDLDSPIKKSKMFSSEIKWSNYIEYDFSKHKTDDFGNKIIKSRQSFYVGVGGFIGYNQISRGLVYDKNGEEYNERTQARFNSNPFIYGVGGYIGYQNFNIKATYNLNPVFKNSISNQNIFNIALVLELF